jgi:hypothetical protein
MSSSSSLSRCCLNSTCFLYVNFFFDEFLVYFFQIDPPGHDGVKKYRLVNLREILRGLVVFIRVLLGEVCYDDVLKKIILANAPCSLFCPKTRWAYPWARVFPARLKHTSRSCAGWTNPRCPLSGKVMVRDVVRDVVHDVVVAVDGDVCLVYQLVYGSNCRRPWPASPASPALLRLLLYPLGLLL